MSLGIKNISSGNSSPQWNTFSICNHDIKCSKFGSFKGTTIPTICINPFPPKNRFTEVRGLQKSHFFLFIWLITRYLAMPIFFVKWSYKSFQSILVAKSRRVSDCVLFLQRQHLALHHPPVTSEIIRRHVCQWAHSLFQPAAWSEWLDVHSDQGGLWHVPVPWFRCNLKVSECISFL